MSTDEEERRSERRSERRNERFGREVTSCAAIARNEVIKDARDARSRWGEAGVSGRAQPTSVKSERVSKRDGAWLLKARSIGKEQETVPLAGSSVKPTRERGRARMSLKRPRRDRVRDVDDVDANDDLGFTDLKGHRDESVDASELRGTTLDES